MVERVHQHVLSGMGLLVLHSGHWSKIFGKLMGTTCTLRWRSEQDRELVWTVNPTHPITRGVPNPIIIDAQEMYGETFDIPAPDELIFISSFTGGEVFRSGCTFRRGHGKIFFFSPGDQDYPVYHHKDVRRVIANGVEWAQKRAARPSHPDPVALRHRRLLQRPRLHRSHRGPPGRGGQSRRHRCRPQLSRSASSRSAPDAMGRAWLQIIGESDQTELVGLVDLNTDAARQAADAHGFPGVAVAASLEDTVRPGGRPGRGERHGPGRPRDCQQHGTAAWSAGAVREAAGRDRQPGPVDDRRRRAERATADGVAVAPLLAQPVGVPAADRPARADRHRRLRVLQGAPLRWVPRGDAVPAADRHGDPSIRPGAGSDRQRTGRGLLQLLQPQLELVRRRRGRSGAVRVRQRKSLQLQRKLVQPRTGNLLERRVAGQRRGRQRRLGR